MSYYLLPQTSFLIHKYIDYVEGYKPPTAVISNSLSTYLTDIKQKIDERARDWDIFKKYTNPYEYVHTLVPYKKTSVSKSKPLSRSFFKMIEMIQTFQLVQTTQPIHTFHLAEGPGGFIEAVSYVRKNRNDVYIGMTLMDEKNDPNIPGWKKTNNFLKQNPNVYIETGQDGTGNILSMQNLIGCKDTYGSSIDFITTISPFLNFI